MHMVADVLRNVSGWVILQVYGLRFGGGAMGIVGNGKAGCKISGNCNSSSLERKLRRREVQRVLERALSFLRTWRERERH